MLHGNIVRRHPNLNVNTSVYARKLSKIVEFNHINWKTLIFLFPTPLFSILTVFFHFWGKNPADCSEYRKIVHEATSLNYFWWILKRLENGLKCGIYPLVALILCRPISYLSEFSWIPHIILIQIRRKYSISFSIWVLMSKRAWYLFGSGSGVW